MTRRGRTRFNAVLGVLTLMPQPLFFGFMALVVITPENHEPPQVPTASLMVLFTVVTFGTLVFLIFDAMRNERLSEAQRTQWVLILLFLAVFTMPVYWWQYRWRS